MVNKQEIIKLYVKEKKSMKEISKIYNTSPQTIMRVIHKYNIPINKYPKAWNSGKTYRDDLRILAKEKHPRTKNTIYYNSDFKRLRREILPCKCGICGNVARTIHHKDLNKMNNSINNLKPLCSSCHTRLHNRLRGKTIYKHDCEFCGDEFIILHNKKCKQRFCSLSCKASYRYHKEENPLKKINLQL